MADHRGTGQVERLIRTIKERLGALKVEKGPKYSREAELKIILRELRYTPNSVTKKSPFEIYFGRKPNTELRILTNPASTQNLNRYDILYPTSIIDLGKIVVYDDEDSIVQEGKNKRQQLEDAAKEVVELQSESDESDQTPLAQKKETGKVPKRPAKTTIKYYAKTNPKKAGKPTVVKITDKIQEWTPHTVILKSGKILRKSDVCKRLETEPGPETTVHSTTNRQPVGQAAGPTVAGQKNLEKEIRAEFEKLMEKRDKTMTPVPAKGPEPKANFLPEGATRAVKGPKKNPTKDANATPKAT